MTETDNTPSSQRSSSASSIPRLIPYMAWTFCTCFKKYQYIGAFSRLLKGAVILMLLLYWFFLMHPRGEDPPKLKSSLDIATCNFGVL